MSFSSKWTIKWITWFRHTFVAYSVDYLSLGECWIRMNDRMSSINLHAFCDNSFAARALIAQRQWSSEGRTVQITIQLTNIIVTWTRIQIRSSARAQDDTLVINFNISLLNWPTHFAHWIEDRSTPIHAQLHHFFLDLTFTQISYTLPTYFRTCITKNSSWKLSKPKHDA